jgi:small nuclear ribonucleoprotein (snRNP)-like protein
MKKLITIILVLSISLFAKTELFDYDLWAKDLKVLIKLSQKDDGSIKGYDKNHNFVRDDVENYIKDKYAKDEFQKIMFLEAAKKIQQIITLPKNSSQKIHKKLDEELLQIYTCRDFILYKHNDIDIEKEMQDKSEFKSKVLNTTKRLNAYISHKQKLPFSYSIPSDEELEKQKP